MKLLHLLLETTAKSENGRIISKHRDKCTGDFICYAKKLTTLEGCPTTVTGDFQCQQNKLTSLEHCPSSVGGKFVCYDNYLTSLEHCPSSIGDYFSCSDNLLTSLEGCPSSIGNDFNCLNNKLTSLEGVHKYVSKIGRRFCATHNPIKSHVLGLFFVQGCREVSLDNKEVTTIMNKHLPQGRAGLIPCQNELIEAGFEDYAQI